MRLVVLRRRPAQLQLVQFELRPLTLALEAPLLLRLGRLASTAVVRVRVRVRVRVT